MTRPTDSTRDNTWNRLALAALAALMVASVALTGCPGDDDDDNDQVVNNLGRLFNNGSDNNGSGNVGGGDVLGGGGTGTNGPGGGSTTDPGSPAPGQPGDGGGGTVTTPGGGGSAGASCASACDMLDYCGILAELGTTAGECTVLCADENPDPSDLAVISAASCDELWYAVFGDTEPASGSSDDCYEYEGDVYCEGDDYPTTPGEDPYGEGEETWDIDDVHAYCAEFPEDCEAYCAEYPEDCEALGL